MSLLAKTGKSTVSFSALDNWLTCGERFRLERIVGVDSTPAYWFAGGTAVHAGTETADRTLEITDNDYPTARLAGIAAYHKSFESSLNEYPDAEWRAGGRSSREYPNREDGYWWGKNGPDQVVRYVQWRSEHPELSLWRGPDSALGVELGVEFEMLGGVKVRGFIDRVFTAQHGGPIIFDIKSGSREPASSLQLAIYAIGLKKCYGIAARLGSYYMTRKGAATPVVDISRYTEGMIARWFRDFTQAVEHDIYIPHVTALCGSCSVESKCYARNASAELPNFNSDLTLETV